MAIEGLNLYTQGNPQYGIAGHQGRIMAPESVYGQGRKQVNPYDRYAAAASARYGNDDLELANKIATLGVDSASSNPFGTKGVTKTAGLEGSAFQGFKVPENNGTGELSPKYNEGERILDLKA